MADYIVMTDMGNSATKCALVDKDLQITSRVAIPTHAPDFADRLIEHIDSMLESNNSIRAGVLSSVVPSKTISTKERIAEKLRVPLFEVMTSRVDWFRLHYQPISSFGTDRLCGVIAARELYPLPAVVIDFGTSTTVNAINANGDFIGGLIFPGVETMLWSLTERTAQLPAVDAEYGDRLLGTSTAESIFLGVRWITQYGLKLIIEKLQRHFTMQPSIVVSGGASRHFDESEMDFHRDTDLILRGGRIYFDKIIIAR